MRSPDVRQPGMFSHGPVQDRVPNDRPMRELRALAGAILGGLDDVPAARHAAGGHLSSAPERRLRAALPRAVHGVHRCVQATWHQAAAAYALIRHPAPA